MVRFLVCLQFVRPSPVISNDYEGQHNVKVRIEGVADIHNPDRSQRITDEATLSSLDGFEYDCPHGAFSDFMDCCDCHDALEKSGDIALRYCKERQCVLYVTEFLINRVLSDSELTNVMDRTAAQWSDGLGSGFNTLCGDEFDLFVDYTGGKSTVQMLTDDGSPIEPPVPRLLQVMRDGDIAAFKSTVPDADINETHFGATPLQIAIRENRFDHAIHLVQSGADLDYYDREQLDALSLAPAFLSDSDATKLIDEIVARKHAENTTIRRTKINLRRPAMVAIENHKQETLKTILQHGGKLLTEDVMRFAPPEMQ